MGEGVAARMAPSRAVVADAVERDKVMYGITTGFGALADTHVGRGDLERMQLALIRSHSAGVGEPLPDDVVRGLLLLRARTLTGGYSGVPHRAAGQAARAARPRPAAGDPRQGLGRRVRRPGPARRTSPSRWSARAGCAGAATPTCAAGPRPSCWPRRASSRWCSRPRRACR